MKVIIHSGWHKTGSTALQNFCLMNSETLESKKVIFPETGLLAGAHHRIPWSLQHEKRNPWALSSGHSHEDASLASMAQSSPPALTTTGPDRPPSGRA
jgi:hypothetical protein